MVKLLPFLLVLVMLSCSQVLMVTEVKVAEYCEDMLFVSWTTSVDSKGLIELCDDIQCYCTTREPEWGKLHSIVIPDVKKIKIITESRDGQVVHYRIK